jgi:hypothetical protein|tara:strand:+ start:69 stop:518 length:450 start_codon:yes stop_codon:yes gene_type:complete
MSLAVTPINLDEANAFVEQHHRHHKPVPGAKFCVAVSKDDEVRGVAIVGRPVSRHIDDGWTLEVNRCCTDGTRNACSMLYATAWKAAKAMGYKSLITYTMESEGGASLRGAGWRCVGKATTRVGQGWNVRSRPRVDTHPLQQKLKWEVC